MLWPVRYRQLWKELEGFDKASGLISALGCKHVCIPELTRFICWNKMHHCLESRRTFYHGVAILETQPDAMLPEANTFLEIRHQQPLRCHVT